MFSVVLASIYCCSVAQSCPILCDPLNCSTPGFPVLHHLLEFAQTHVHWVSDAIQPSHPPLPSSPPTLNLSQHQGLFQWVGCLHPVAKYCLFRFSTSPFSEYSRLSSFRTDWFDLLAVQGTLKSLLQHHSSKASSAYLHLNILGKISARTKTRKSALTLVYLLSLPSVNVLSSLNWTIPVNLITCLIS